MEYLLLIYTDEKASAERSDEERQAVIREYYELADELRDYGSYITSAPLLPTTVASTVRVRDDELLVTAGPFAETKDQLGGYFLIEAESDEGGSLVGGQDAGGQVRVGRGTARVAGARDRAGPVTAEAAFASADP
jgi:hypothetical protein